jgi:hypothetical protein
MTMLRIKTISLSAIWLFSVAFSPTSGGAATGKQITDVQLRMAIKRAVSAKTMSYSVATLVSVVKARGAQARFMTMTSGVADLVEKSSSFTTDLGMARRTLAIANGGLVPSKESAYPGATALEGISIGRHVWMNDTSSIVDPNGPSWSHVDGGKTGIDGGDLASVDSLDQTRGLTILRGLSDGAKRVAGEDLEGVSTTKFEMMLTRFVDLMSRLI